MKHGPIALLDAKVPVVTIAMPGTVFEKVLSNAQEARARDARLIGVTPMDEQEAADTFDTVIPVPHVDEILSPIVTVIPCNCSHITLPHGEGWMSTSHATSPNL